MSMDYTKFNQGGDGNQQFNKRWWSVNKTDRSGAVFSVVKFISQYDSKRQTQYQISNRLYGNNNLIGMNGLSFSKMASSQNVIKDRISYNVVQSVIETIVAKMAKNNPKPMFLTEGGDYKMQRKAKKLDKFCEGIFYENEVKAVRNQSLLDASVFGDAFVQVFEHEGRVKWERVLPSEIFVDWMEGFYGHPRQLHRIKNMDREVLVDMFPEHKAAIKRANSASADLTGAYQNVADQVTVCESWHLPSGEGAGDGKHCIVIEGEDPLLDEEWKKDFFPFAHRTYAKRLFGYWGQGAAERIQNIQLEINKILWVIQRSMHLAGTFKVWLKTGTKMPKEFINNDIGAILTGDEPPQYLVPPVVPPEYYSHLQTLKNQAFEQEGVSQLSATSQKPMGLDSGKALREYNDIETDRFMVIGQNDEQFVLDLASLSISVAKDIYERDGKYPVKIPGKKFIQTIDWKDVDLEDDEYVMKMFPVSSLPQDPAGKLQTIQEYAQAGFLDPQQARKLLDFPDLDQVEDLNNAQEEWIGKILDGVIDDGSFSPPEPEMDLQMAKKMVLQYIAQAKCNGLEEEKSQMLRDFNEQIDVLVQKSMPPAPPVMPGAPADPTQTPTSDLIPNVNGAEAPLFV